MNSISIPEDYICPITQELMKDPVVAADGHSYERDAILHWLQGGHKTSPLTGVQLKNDVLIENHRLKSIIETFQQNQQERQMIAQDAEKHKKEKREYDEALKKKDEENKVLKESLLNLQKQIQEIKNKVQPSVQPILQNIANGSNVDNPERQSLISSTKYLECSRCRFEIIEKLVFTNENCIHQYCLSCIQAERNPNVNFCYLKTCKSKLNQSKLSAFIQDCVRLDIEALTVKPLKDKIEKMQEKIAAKYLQRESQQIQESQITKTKNAINSLKAQIPKTDWTTLAISPPTRYLKCSICHCETIEHLVYSNKYCRHRYCIDCIKATGKPKVGSCFLKVCPATLDTRELKRFYFMETGLRLK